MEISIFMFSKSWGDGSQPHSKVTKSLWWGASPWNVILFPSVFRHCWLGNRKDTWPVKSLVFVFWWCRFDWSFERLIALVVTSTSIILSWNKIKEWKHSSPAYPDCLGKWPFLMSVVDIQFQNVKYKYTRKYSVNASHLCMAIFRNPIILSMVYTWTSSKTDFLFLFIRTISLKIIPGHTRSPESLQRRNFGDCWSRNVYTLDAHDVTESTESKHLSGGWL